MHALDTEITNVVLKADGCFDLPAFKTEDGRYVTFWNPSKEELRKLNEGGAVALHVYANSHPPVAVEVVESGLRAHPAEES